MTHGAFEPLLGVDLYKQEGRLREDDLAVRNYAAELLARAAQRIGEAVVDYQRTILPPSTREQPFPPAGVMEPIRRAERLLRSLTDVSTLVNGLPVINQDRVWNRVRHVGLDELLQFDWTLVGEADALATAAGDWAALDEVDVTDAEARLKRIRDVAGDRRRYLEVQA